MKVWVEVDSLSHATRIFRNKKSAFQVPEGTVVHLMDRAEAVRQIRDAVYVKQGALCADCGVFLTRRAHLHEKKTRGQGGEISVENSQMLCAKCHIIGRGSAHGDRVPRFSTLGEREGK